MLRVPLPLLLTLVLLTAATSLPGCRPAGAFARRTGDTPEYAPEIPAASTRHPRTSGRENPLTATAWEQSADAVPSALVATDPPATASLPASQPILRSATEPSDDSPTEILPSPFQLAGFSTEGSTAADPAVSAADPANADPPASGPSTQVPRNSKVAAGPELSLQRPPAELAPAPAPATAPLNLDNVITSVYQSYPMLLAALQNRNLAFGQQVGASGAFDTKLKGASENGALGFYQTYRQSIGLVQPTYWGGEVFGGYRVGRGDYQPWYQERQTNDGGEFKAGVQVPLARNRSIDDRRAELWKAGLERQLAEPDIQARLISAVQDGSYAWWDWVAAGEYHRIAVRILALAEERTSRIRSQVEVGFLDPPELTDNLRLVAIRQAKVADTRRKLQQTGAKLSIFLRDEAGNPVLPRDDQLPGFPAVPGIDSFRPESDTQLALERRPELRMLDLLSRQVRIDLSNASNQLQPELNAVLWGSQDVGERTSKKGDKSPLEAEASVFLDVPIERRKARGKITESQAKLAQLAAKRRLTADKIMVDVRMAYAAIASAFEQVSETQAALRYAEELAERERQNLEAGASDLLKVTLREQYAVESAEKQIDALKLFHESLADYRAAIAQDQLNQQTAP
ncbi:MAG: TolC family protein [Planctomycetota bacterium]